MSAEREEAATVGRASLSATQAEELDRACDRFEAEWRAGGRPDLSSYLAGRYGTERAALVRELVAIDVHWRRRAGERPGLDDYLAGLPGDARAVRAALHELDPADTVDSVFLTEQGTRRDAAGPDDASFMLPSDPAGREGRPASTSPSSDTDITRVSVPGYEILHVLGRGGMGVVYKARQISLNRHVALKMIRSAALASAEEVRRFENEAEAVARLDHPNIVPIFEVGQSQGQHYFSMKLVAGEGLDKRLEDFVGDPRRAARLMALVAGAIHHAHQRGILHRDLKPANVLVDASGQPHVTDFGLARRIEGDSELTQSGAILGTPAYMAPEQVSAVRGAVTTAADVYGLGAILYALLTGRKPFGGTTVLETLEQVRDLPPEPPRALNPRVSRDLEIVCLKCLEKDPRLRYAGADAMAADLERWLAGEPISARPVGQAARLRMWCRRNPMPAASATAAVLAVLVGLFGTTWGWLESTRQAEFARRMERESSRQADLATRREGEARTARSEAERQLERAERTIYQMRLKEAEEALRANDHAEARAALARCRWDFRGWEHAHLTHRLNAGHRIIPRVDSTPGVAFTPGGDRLLSGRDDGSLDVYALGDGSIERAVRLHDDRVDELVINAAGTLAAAVAARESRLVVLFDPRTGQVARRIRLPEGVEPASAAFGPAGRWLAVGCWNGRVRVYDPGSGELVRELVAFPTIPESVSDFQLVPSPAGPLICRLVPHVDEPWEDPRVFDPDSGRPSKLPFPLAGVRHLTFDPSGSSVAAGTGRGGIIVYDAHSGAVRRALTDQPAATAVAFDPGVRRLVVAGEDRLVRVWDLEQGGVIAVHAGHTGYVFRVFVRPIGGEVVSVSADGTARVWAARGAGPRPWAGHTAALTDLAVSPDGRRVLTASFDGTARVWDAATGAGIHTFRGHTGEVYAAAISPDGRRAATGGEDRTVRLWDLESGACERVYRQEFEVYKLAFVSAGRILISDHVTGEGPFAPAALFDLATGEVVRRIGHPEAADRETYRLAASPDGRAFAIGYDNGDVVVWSSADDQVPVILRGHGAFVDGLAFFPDGRRLASASADHTGRVWDMATGRAEQELRAHTDSVIALAISPDGRRVVTSSYDGRVIVWDASSGSDLLRLSYASRPGVWARMLAFGADGTLHADGLNHDLLTWSAQPQIERAFTGHARRVTGLAYLGPDAIVSGDSDGILRVWDPSTGRERRQLVGHTDAVNAVAALPDGRRVVTAGHDRTVRVWDAVSNRQLLRMRETATPATALAVSPDGRRMAAAVPGREADGSPTAGEVIIADTDTGGPVLRLPMTGGRVWRLAYAPAGQRLATACADGKIRLWNPTDGRLEAEWAGHKGRVLAVAFSADGSKVASGGDDRLATLWDAATGRPVWRHSGHVHQISEVSFSPDGRLLATAGYDGQVREWDAVTGEEVARHATARGSLECVAYAPDGTAIAFGGGDTAVRVGPSARHRLTGASGRPNVAGPHEHEHR